MRVRRRGFRVGGADGVRVTERGERVKGGSEG